ncbi:AraC-like DNA-binding protein [Variovorax boronicumulans]|uniref:AraC family transcriptional regulator n=1 Tax=Variovorax boronicumulans TaxID=436515 RepID=UPI002474D4A2|nr:AraC family transcriptional regulator [Variovorax boronicumulans]MDH6166915.1 AraC-like DNA-binding protein [Variovorax boronicumulans]
MNLRALRGDPQAAPVHGGVARSHFSVQGEPPHRQLLAWRERVGHVIDVLPSKADIEKPFRAEIDRYKVDGLLFTDCRSDAMLLERSLARISTDSVRDYVFHVFTEGGVEDIALRASPRHAAASTAISTPTTKILALDMNQPVRMRRSHCRVLTLFVPGALVQEVFPDPEAIHGRAIQDATPLTRLALEHVTALGANIGGMSAAAADSAVRTAAHLVVAAFGKQAGLSGNARSAARAALFGRVRRHIQANLHRAELTPEGVINALHLTRPTVYRMFQHEGGLGAYIRHLRLRQAADELARYPHMMVTDVAYAVGFKSASDFTRAFRRAYGMAPQEFRALSQTFRADPAPGIGIS